MPHALDASFPDHGPGFTISGRTTLQRNVPIPEQVTRPYCLLSLRAGMYVRWFDAEAELAEAFQAALARGEPAIGFAWDGDGRKYEMLAAWVMQKPAND